MHIDIVYYGQVLAGGLHDNCRAVVAGATSFGKGAPTSFSALL